MVLWPDWRLLHDTDRIMILSACKKFFIKYLKILGFRLL